MSIAGCRDSLIFVDRRFMILGNVCVGMLDECESGERKANNGGGFVSTKIGRLFSHVCLLMEAIRSEYFNPFAYIRFNARIF